MSVSVSPKKRGAGTIAVHGAGDPKPGSLTTPIAQTSTFVFESSAEMRRYLEGGSGLHLYTRYENPTLGALEEALAALEGGEDALVLGSGMAASTTALLALLKPGDEILASASLYGGTTKLVRHWLARLGFGFRILPAKDLVRIDMLASDKSKLVVFETPTNPSVEVVDISAVARAAHVRGMLVMIDSTFATPVLQQPLALGADLVMHSLTKALSGHSDIIGGALVGSKPIIAKARDAIKVLGGCMDPHAAFLALRGLKTVHLRVPRMCENALALAKHLEAHPKVSRVIYPGLTSHSSYAVAARQMSAPGGMLSFVLPGGLPAAERFYDGLSLMARAASLGGVETLVSLPLHTSHAGFTPAELAEAGVDPGSVRISLGVEDAEDLIADADAALAKV